MDDPTPALDLLGAPGPLLLLIWIAWSVRDLSARVVALELWRASHSASRCALPHQHQDGQQ
jgi:hypothetical protein